MFRARSTAIAFVLSATAFSISCVDDGSTGPEFQQQVAVIPGSLESLGEDPPMIAIAKQLPTFAGFWFNDNDQVVVGLTDVSHLARARELIKPHLGAHQPKGGFVAQQVEFTFLQLAQWRHRIRRARIFDIPGVTVLGVRESANRVHIGLDDVGAEHRVRLTFGAAGIPQKAVMFRLLGRARLSVGNRRGAAYASFFPSTLRSQYDTLMGGIQMRAGSSGWCTLGFTIIRGNGAAGFISNSHCTDVEHTNDGSLVEQPLFDTRGAVGQEILDPPTYTCGYPGFQDPCRNADAAMFSATFPSALGKIARPNYRRQCETSEDESNCGESITIDQSNPVILITGRNPNVFENEIVDKIGARTGWTYGAVEDTCDDFKVGGWVRECSDRVDYGAEGGDSGSPVFYLKSDGTAELRGIHYASQYHPFGYADSWMSDLHQIELDLGGPLVVYYKTMSPYIDGPSFVPANVQCSWAGIPNGGQPLYQYTWYRDGVPVDNTNAYYANSGPTDFTLSFTVTDGRGNTSGASMYVDVNENSTELTCI